MIVRHSIRRFSLVSFAVVVAVGLLGFDGTLHWDEPGYLYAGIYQDLETLLRAEVQPSGIPAFTAGKILHILLIHLAYTLTDSPPAAAFLVAGCYTLLLTASLVLAARLTARLLPGTPDAVYAGMLAVALAPTIAYLAFKTLPDIPGLFLGCAATYAILRAATANRGGALWVAIGIVGLAMAALAKLQAIVLPATFVLAGLLFPLAGLERRRLFVNGAIVGLTAGALTVLVLTLLPIGVDRFLGSSDLLTKPSPLAAKLMHIALTAGMVWLLLPFSFLSESRQAVRFFWLWLLLATAPFLMLFEHAEPRYLATSLMPMVGIAALALDAIRRRVGPLVRRRRGLAVAIAGGLVLLALGSSALAQRVMPHEVALFELRRTLDRLDERYDDEPPTLLTAWRYTDFHILRVLWPERPVYSVDSTPLLIEPLTDASPSALATAYLGGRQIDTLDTLAALDGPLLLIGFEETFAPVNLAAILDVLRPGLGRQLLDAFDLIGHLETSWIWHSDHLQLTPVSATGHYRVFEVQPM